MNSKHCRDREREIKKRSWIC